MRKFNQSYFNEINTEEKAYWLGFIFADGNLRILPSYLLRINLSSKDHAHLVKFCTAIELQIEPRKYYSGKYPCSSVSIGSKTMGEHLLRLGIVPRKSTQDIKITVPRDLQKHYWRGVFDGDGSVGLTKRNHMSISLNGRLEMINSFVLFLKENGIIGGSTSAHSSIYKFKTVGTHIASSIFRLLYTDSTIFLDRKKNSGDAIVAMLITSGRIVDANVSLV